MIFKGSAGFTVRLWAHRMEMVNKLWSKWFRDNARSAVRPFGHWEAVGFDWRWNNTDRMVRQVRRLNRGEQ